MESLQRTLQSQPDNEETHDNLAFALVGLGRPNAAIHHYREAIRLRPNWPTPLTYLAWLRATHADRSWSTRGNVVWNINATYRMNSFAAAWLSGLATTHPLACPASTRVIRGLDGTVQPAIACSKTAAVRNRYDEYIEIVDAPFSFIIYRDLDVRRRTNSH